MADIKTVKGAKAGQDKPRKPSIAKDSVASTSTAKLLYILGEGEIAGLVDGGKSIYLDGTPLLDDAGNSNFDGVTWDFRPGTNEQDYIKGFPDVANETPVNVELRSDNPWIKAFTDTQLSAVRVRFKWNRLSKTNPENGDVKGYKIQYAIDLQTNGGAYVEVLNTKIEDKTSAGYERTHRIDLPKSTTGWQIRVRRITPNDSSEYVQDTMLIDAVAEVIDVKLRYPNTALLGLQYNAETFSGIAKMEARIRGMIIRVPSNYDPVTRTYTGIWDGTFKDAYSNNPAWIYFDLCTQWRYGLGDRLDITMIDKWSLYALGQYCDQMVSDGKGGLEPRFTCNVYLQKQVDAYQVLQNIGGIFRAMSYWNGEQVVLDADVPQDPVYTFSRANVIEGNFEYTGARTRDRHTLAKVAWDNPLNRFETEYEYIRDEKAMAKFGNRELDLSAFGCTSQAQAQRAGLWALKTEQLETRQVSFGVGLDGFIPSVGNIINISDELFAGRANGGRVSAVSDAQYVVTVDRDVVASAGDVLIVNGGGGQSERRTIKSVAGRKITLNAAFTAAEKENVWAIETADLKLMRFRVMSIAKNDETTFAITAIQHEPQKYDAIDFGTDVKPTEITIVNPDVVDAPASVTITSRHRVVQGQTIATLIIAWAQVKDAVAYDVEWRKDDGTWVKVPRTGNVSVEIEGVYSGNYMARVRSVSPFDVQSQPTTSVLTEVKGKVGLPPTIVGLTATGILFGMEIKWGFSAGSGDAAYTEIETGSAPNTNVKLLGQYSYPTNTHTVTGLQGNLSQSYRARLVDKLGFKSAWSAWVTGITDASADKIMELIQGQIDESVLDQALRSEIGKIDTNKTLLDNVSIDVSKAKADIVTATNKANAAKASADANKVDLIAVNEAVANNQTAVDSSITTLTNKDISLTNLYTALQSEYATNKAKVTQDLKTLSDKDISLTNLLTALDSDYKGNKASVTNSLSTLTAKDTALTNGLNSLTSTVGIHTSSINSMSTTIANNTQSIAQTKSDLTASFANVDNIVVDGDVKVTNADYQINFYRLSRKPVVGNFYKVTIKGALGADRDSFRVYNTNGTVPLATLIAEGDGIYSASFKWVNTNGNNTVDDRFLVVYQFFNGATSISTIDSIELTRDVGAKDRLAINATVTSNNTALTNKDLALASSIDSLTSEYGSNKASVTQSLSTLTTKTNALVTADTVIRAEISSSDNLLRNSSMTSLEGWSGNGASLSIHIDTYMQVTYNAASTPGLKADGFYALTKGQYTLSGIFSSNTDNNIRLYLIQQGKSTFVSPTFVLSTQLTQRAFTFEIPDDYDNCAIYLLSPNPTAGRVTYYGNLKLEKGRMATPWTPSSIDGYAAIQETKAVVAGLSAQYTLKLDVGGRISGFGLMSSATQSDFAINADKFWIAPPTGTSKGKSPFMVLASPQTINGTVVPAGTYMDSTFIHKAAIDTLQVKDGAIKSAQIDSLAVKSGNIDNLAVTTGKIANLAVDTLQIKGNAVTVPIAKYIDGITSVGAIGMTHIASLATVPSIENAIISISASYFTAKLTDGSGTQFSVLLLKDGVIIRDMPFPINGSESISAYFADIISITDKPSANGSTYTFAVEPRWSGGGSGRVWTVFQNLNFSIIGAKK
ncbi:TipJ family phage tail tip protein [Psychrobacter glaciei]|uniref:TipJ family phage tail tip protein n=1 Tax=Psychrobacter glaciei TaxID=619771 RepID=UPI003F47B442